MDFENYKFRYDAYKNNTFDLDVLEKSLDESKMSGYQYLRQFQLESTGYKRFDFNMQDIYRTNNINHNFSLVPVRWVFFVDYEFINVGKRLAYKRSELYEKDISFNDIINRPDLFDSTFLVFINGKLYTRGVKILCKEDKTYMIFFCKENITPDGFGVQEMREYIQNNAKVSIYFIPNIGIKNIPTNAYRLRTLNKSDGLPLRNLALNDYVDYKSSLAYINHINGIYSIPTNITFNDKGLMVDDLSIKKTIDYDPNNTALNLQLIPLRNLLCRIELTNSGWFEIPLQDYPVAIENCIVMDEDMNFLHDATITHYYPNIYYISNVDNILKSKKVFIYVFYFENKINKLKHLDMLAAYHKYVPDYLERYKNNTIPEIVKNFNPKIVEYSIKDYRKGLIAKDGKLDRDELIFIRDENDLIYKIYLYKNDLYSELYERNDRDNIPQYYYVYDTITSITYKLYLNEGNICADISHDKIEYPDELYLYDPIEKSHNLLGVERGVLALFDFVSYKDHFKYKIIKMREFIKADVNNFRKYLYNLNLGNNYYYVDVSKIDLNLRKRTNNKDTGLRYVDFKKEMYMFVFRNDFERMYDDIMVHVDGTRYEEEILLYRTSRLDYIYIPCELVHDNSMLEIEKLTETKKTIPFKSQHTSDIIKLNIGEPTYRNKILYNDLFVVDKATGEYLKPDSYQLILPIKFHMDDIESDIVLDYIITENTKGYLEMAILEHGLIEIYDNEDVDNNDNSSMISVQNNKNEFYQFDIKNNRVSFNKVDSVNDYVINKLRSMTDKNLVYQFKMDKGSIKIEISEDDGQGKTLAEGGLNLYDNNNIFIQCPKELKIKITNEAYLNRDLLLYVKKDHDLHFIKDIQVNENNDYNFKPISIRNIDSKKDISYFRIYRNGRLIPRHMFEFNNVKYNLVDNIDIILKFIKEKEKDYEFLIEVMPYRMKQVCYIDRIPNDKVINLKGKIDKPFDFKWYDLYINGKKIVRKDVEIISANIIKILKSDSLNHLEIIEHSRDIEYFGNVKDSVYDIIDNLFEEDKIFADNINNSIKDNDLIDKEEPIVNKELSALDILLKIFYDFLCESFGFINPDELQISREQTQRFNGLINENYPMVLGLDEYGKNKINNIILHINPDNK